MSLMNFFAGFIQIAEGLAMIVSLGRWCPHWTMDFYCWWTEKTERKS